MRVICPLYLGNPFLFPTQFMNFVSPFPTIRWELWIASLSCGSGSCRNVRLRSGEVKAIRAENLHEVAAWDLPPGRFRCFENTIWLVVWLPSILFSHILGTIIPIDVHIFQRGWNHQPAILFRCAGELGPRSFLTRSWEILDMEVSIVVEILQIPPIAGWFIVEILWKWMIWGYPHFRKPPHVFFFTT